jgi:hypothetical protein
MYWSEIAIFIARLDVVSDDENGGHEGQSQLDRTRHGIEV